MVQTKTLPKTQGKWPANQDPGVPGQRAHGGGGCEPSGVERESEFGSGRSAGPWSFYSVAYWFVFFKKNDKD